jgi:acyl-CoA reductase-like NAD-dependent aldehyde dehydrogenase
MSINEVRTYKYYAGGEWRPATTGKTFDVLQPFGGQLYANVAAGGAEDARIAVQAAADAFPAWSQTTPAERARLFLKAGEIVKRRRTEIAEVLARETGSDLLCDVPAGSGRRDPSRSGRVGISF